MSDEHHGSPIPQADELDPTTGLLDADVDAFEDKPSRYVVTSDRGTLRYLSSAEVSVDARNIPGVRDAPVGDRTHRASSSRSRRRASRSTIWMGALALTAIAVLVVVFALL